MSNLLSLTATQLRRAADLKEKVEALTKELAFIFGGSVAIATKAFKKGMSAAGRAKVSAAQKKRWAKIKKAKPAAKAPVKRRKMSKAAKAKISAAAKKRWAKVKAAGKKSL